MKDNNVYDYAQMLESYTIKILWIIKILELCNKLIEKLVIIYKSVCIYCYKLKMYFECTMH